MYAGTENMPWIFMVAVLAILYKIINPLHKRFENSVLDERELMIRMKVEKIQWRIQASFLYLAVFLPLTASARAED